MKPVDAWEAPIKDLSQLDRDSAKFLHDSAEKRLKNILDVSDRTTNRAISILTASIPLIGFVLSLLFRHYFGKEQDQLTTSLLIISLLGLSCSVFSVTLLAIVAFPRQMHQLGREPKMIFVEDFTANKHFQNEAQYKLLLVAETEDLQQRITFMQAQSNQRVHRLKVGFLTLVLCGGVCFTVLLFELLFR